MGIVRWESDTVTEDMFSESDDALMRVLSMDPKQLENRWAGKLIVQPRATQHRISVELRKPMTGTNVLIKIYADMRGKLGGTVNNLIHMSMNAAVRMSEEDLEEMNMAIAEGIAVYKHPKHWIKLNKYLEESKGRQQRRKDGKFVKQTI